MEEERREVVFLQGAEREARGRNGWFKPQSVSITRIDRRERGAVWLEIRSARSASIAPVHLETDPEDLYQLGIACLKIAAAAGRAPTPGELGRLLLAGPLPDLEVQP